uniref:TonB-dependent receptor n=1 Tax=Prevotella sp. GTC17253 TaxID=3236793 RepID=A0AB33IUY0_9BACT
MTTNYRKVLLGGAILALGSSPCLAAASSNSAEILSVQQQTSKVTGTVTDDYGPIIGASVVVKGQSMGTVTDLDGHFSLNVKKGQTLVITYVGFDKKEVVYNGEGSLNIKMAESSQLISEVVVTGYGGKTRRAKLTNSISKVKEDAFNVGVYSNPAQALAGAVAGLRVTSTSGNPGSTPRIVLRGGTNLDGTGSPLVMVDGQLRESLSDINPEDIESMEILKDAGATALYGARANNGVILVTTKTGKSGHREINLKAKVGWNYVNNPYKFLGAKDYITYQRLAYANSDWADKSNLIGTRPFGTGNKYGPGLLWNILPLTDENKGLLDKGWQSMADPLDANKTLIYRETDFEKYSFNNPALTQDYNVSMSGGNDRGTYYAGLGYNKSEGIPIKSFYERYNFTFNGSYKVTDWLKSTSNFSFNRANWQSMPGSQTSEANYFGRIQSLPPTARFDDEDGNMVLGPNSGDGNQSYQPEKWDYDNQSDKFTMVQSFDAELIPNLMLHASGQWYYDEVFQSAFVKDFLASPGKINPTRSTTEYFNRAFSQTYNATISYNTTFLKDHTIDGLLGTEYYDRYTKGFQAQGVEAPTDDFADLGLTSTKENKRAIDSWHERYRILSYFGRVNYDYQDKYLLSGVFRYDGYSSLLGSNRWGFFPGVSAGWVATKENFVKEALPFLSYGKLRTSYGVNGNASGIGAYKLQGRYNTTTYNGNTGFLIGELPNPTLRWEKSHTFEIAVELGFLKNRLTANFTYYNRLTQDKYATLTLPSTTGFSGITNNNGKFRNRGVEMEFGAQILKTKDMSWNANLNLAYNINKIVALPYNKLERNRQNAQEIYTGRKIKNAAGKEVDETVFVGGYQEGQEPGLLVGYQADGIYKSYDEIPGNLIVKSGNINAKSMYGPKAWESLTDEQKKNALRIQPGDVKWRDINGDGIIDNLDQVKLGHTMPHWTGGFNSTFKYKGFTLYARLDFALDFKTYDGTTPWFLGNMQGTYNATTDALNTWSESNPNAKYPRYVWADQLGTANYYRTSSMFTYDGSYLSFREIALSYSLPKAWISKLALKNLEVSVTGQNLGYIKSAPIATPEYSHGAGAYSGMGYGLPRTIILGVNATF